VLRKRSFVGASAASTRTTTRAVSTFIFCLRSRDEFLNQYEQDEIFERAQERREQRKLKRLAASVKAQATTFVSTLDPDGGPRCL
jgi:hypothetical protein